MASSQSWKRTVLVVEDDPVLRGILAEALSSEGHEVLTAWNGEDALAMAINLGGHLALVVIDVFLPKMDGLELADRLGGLDPRPALLFISGARTNLVVPGPVLSKPFGPTAFLEQVGRMLSSVDTQ